MPSTTHVQERIVAGRILALAAAKVSERLRLFSGWMLVGIGGAYALVFANLQALERFVWLRSLQWALVWLLVAVVLGTLSHLMSAVVAGQAEAGERGEEMGKSIADRGIEIDFSVVFKEIERGMFYPQRILLRRFFSKMLANDDLAAGGRLTSAIAQIQALLVLAQTGALVIAAAIAAAGIKQSF